MKRNGVLIGISGGVGSAVAAAALKERGFHVEGLYIRNGFPTRAEREAEPVADVLGIPLHRIDVAASFAREIVDYFADEYAGARTPNPCVICNKKIKFPFLIETAAKYGLDYAATGHYARINTTGNGKDLRLMKGVDTGKDQSYFLFMLGRQELERILFPNGDKFKTEIREQGRSLGLQSLTERESQEICFIPDNDYRRFIEEMLPPSTFTAGNIVDGNGTVVGRHRGIHTVTVGQRRGLHIASERPYYVISIDGRRNEVTVGREEDQFFEGLVAEDLSWAAPEYAEEETLRAVVKIRYRHRGVDSTIRPGADGNTVTITFDTPQKAVAPGQAAVFYQDERVIGGGWIEKGLRRA